MATISEALTIARQHREAGRLSAAEQIYRRILQADPRNPEAHHSLGNLCRRQGRIDEAIACYRRVLEVRPDLAEGHNNLGDAYKEKGLPEEAAASFRRALELNPRLIVAHINLGVTLKDQGQLEGAAACFRRAVELEPDFAAGHNNLGNILMELRRVQEALACFERALELEPNMAAGYNNLGLAHKDLGNLAEATRSFRRAVELRPELAETHVNLGNALGRQGRADDAIRSFLRALELKPHDFEAHSNLGNTWKDQGKLEQAIACFRRALELKPDFAAAQSNLLYTLLFHPKSDPRSLAEEHRRWGRQQAGVGPAVVHRNDRSPDRRLRVGYVSPNFFDHCQTLFTRPLFSSHDRERFEIIGYADRASPDRPIEGAPSPVEAWRDLTGLSDEEAARRVRADEIDILVDLTMHLGGNRLRLFARKPAPVQVCWLAYPGTTGLEAIDYRITDPHLDPPGLFDEWCAEASIRLPDTFWCYAPLAGDPEVNALPALENGSVTFGCLNNFCKVNPLVLDLWARALRAVPGSKLTILAPEGSHREETLDCLESKGVARSRLTFVPRAPRGAYLQYYHGIDIGLDTLPYNGHTTSLDSYWMGVPVVTLVGSTVVGRAGLSQLTNLGLPELIAYTPAEYVQMAANLAQDLPRLAGLRSTLRGRMESSPLMDAPRFARNLEAAYRKMWHRWCAP